MLTSMGSGALTAASRASLAAPTKRVALGSLTCLTDRQVLPFSTLREDGHQELLEEIEAATEASTPNAFGGPGYEWEDPFRLKTQLTEEEVRYCVGKGGWMREALSGVFTGDQLHTSTKESSDTVGIQVSRTVP